jgi:hypothetical protein
MNPQNGQTPLDYLNQIAPEAPKQRKIGLNFRTVIIGAIILVMLVSILSLSVGALVNSRREPWHELAARLATTKTIAEDATKKLKNSQIRSANSDLRLYLTNAQRDLAAPLRIQEINPERLSASVVQRERATAMIERLEDARLNAKFDSTYAREMSYQLATILSLYQELYSAGGTAGTRQFLETSYDNLLPIQTTISDFSASNE